MQSGATTSQALDNESASYFESFVKNEATRYDSEARENYTQTVDSERCQCREKMLPVTLSVSTCSSGL